MSRWSLATPASSRRLVAAALGTVLVGGLLGVPAITGLAGASTAPTSGNLLAGDTATLLQRTGMWVGTSNVAKLSTQLTSAGTGSLVIRPKAVGTAVVQTGAGSSAVRATPGSVYSAQVLANAATGLESVTAVLTWYDAAGAAITSDTVPGAPTPEVAGSWVPVAVVGLAPAKAAYVALVVRTPIAVVGETHYLSAPSLTATAGGSAALAGPLRTVGNKIVDANGSVVTLRGINRSGSYTTAIADTATQYDVARIKAWGGNVVRITVGQYLYLPGCPQYDPATASLIDQEVSWVNALGMLAVLDLQWNAPTCATNGLNTMPDPQSKVLWQKLATRYANSPLVAFDLFNEPHDVSDAVWSDGGTATTSSGVSYQAIGMKELYSAVRATGAQNLVFLGGLSYASTFPSTAPLSGTENVVYAVHAYNCDQPSTCVNGSGASWLLDRFVDAGRTNPIMVTEFGWPTASNRSAQSFNNNVISFAEQQGWGWMPWSWPVNGNCDVIKYFDLVANGTCNAGGTYQPSPAAMPILLGLLRNS
jgi:hypothetical protein